MKEGAQRVEVPFVSGQAPFHCARGKVSRCGVIAPDHIVLVFGAEDNRMSLVQRSRTSGFGLLLSLSLTPPQPKS